MNTKILQYPNGSTLYVSGVDALHDLTDADLQRMVILSILPHDQNVYVSDQQFVFAIDDSPVENISQYFESTYPLILDAIFAKKNVLVHCRAGVSRSVTIWIAFFLRTFQDRLDGILVRPYIPKTDPTWTDSILRFIRKHRPIVQPNRGFMNQLYAYEQAIIGRDGVV
jgi:protein-tyrosine phosphatase